MDRDGAHLRARYRTGLSDTVLSAICLQVGALRSWAESLDFDDLLLEMPIHVVHADGRETLGILDIVAVGNNGLRIIDHKTGKAIDPGLRFVSYCPQISDYASALALVFPSKPVAGVAIHWMEEGTISVMNRADTELRHA